MMEAQVIAREVTWKVTEHPGRRGEHGFEDQNLIRQIEERAQAHALKTKHTTGVVIFEGFSVEWRIK